MSILNSSAGLVFVRAYGSRERSGRARGARACSVILSWIFLRAAMSCCLSVTCSAVAFGGSLGGKGGTSSAVTTGAARLLPADFGAGMSASATAAARAADDEASIGRTWMKLTFACVTHFDGSRCVS